MSLVTIKKDIEDRFIANWTGTDIATNVRFENVPFTPPDNESWVSLDTIFANSTNAAIHSSLDTRVNGFIVIDCYAPPDVGAVVAMELADEAITLYQNTQFNRIQCLAARPRHIGINNTQGSDALWFIYRVSVPFYKYT